MSDRLVDLALISLLMGILDTAKIQRFITVDELIGLLLVARMLFGIL